MDGDPLRAMTPGDAAHWRATADWLAVLERAEEPSTARSLLLGAVRLLPGAGAVGDVLADVLGGLRGVGHRLGSASITPDGVLAAFRAAGHDVAVPADLHALEVDDLLAVRPALARAYGVASAVQGGVVGVAGALTAVTGTSGGVQALAGAAVTVGADTVLTAAVCSRAVAHVAAYYGFDAAAEPAVAAAVLGVGVQEPAGRPAALRRLREAERGTSDLTARPARYRAPGCPVLSSRLLLRVVDAADHLYRERFLRAKYAVDGVDWGAAHPVARAG